MEPYVLVRHLAEEFHPNQSNCRCVSENILTKEDGDSIKFGPHQKV